MLRMGEDLGRGVVKNKPEQNTCLLVPGALFQFLISSSIRSLYDIQARAKSLRV